MDLLGIDDNKKIGMFLLAVAGFLYFFGIMFLFKRSMLLISNILFLAGLYFFIGITGIIKFFTKKGKIKGSAIYFGGMLVIVFNWAFLGALLQIFGFFIIFRTFLPDFYDYICRAPVIGSYLKSYTVQNALDKMAGNDNSRI